MVQMTPSMLSPGEPGPSSISAKVGWPFGEDNLASQPTAPQVTISRRSRACPDMDSIFAAVPKKKRTGMDQGREEEVKTGQHVGKGSQENVSSGKDSDVVLGS